MRTWFFSTLLHHANRTTKDERFYAIKDRLLSQFGRRVGYDVQFLEGKKCYSCNGTGIYRGWHASGDVWTDQCWNCHGGWFKLPVWNVLDKIQFGRFSFHQPRHKAYSQEAVQDYLLTNYRAYEGERPLVGHFEGYVDHQRTRYGHVSIVILFLLFDRKNLPHDFGLGLGWRLRWWRPGAWLNNLLHVARRRSNAIPFQNLKKRWHRPQPDLRIFHGEIHRHKEWF